MRHLTRHSLDLSITARQNLQEKQSEINILVVSIHFLPLVGAEIEFSSYLSKLFCWTNNQINITGENDHMYHTYVHTGVPQENET